jgi:hypothetical protein
VAVCKVGGIEILVDDFERIVKLTMRLNTIRSEALNYITLYVVKDMVVRDIGHIRKHLTCWLGSRIKYLLRYGNAALRVFD